MSTAARRARVVSAAEIAAALSEPGTRYVITSHHNPDGDAIGSLLGLARILRARGADVELAHPDGERMPEDLGFLLAEGESLAPRLPDDMGERTLVCVDCASENRLWHEPVHESAGRIVNIDHHGDNTHFGDLNLIEPRASSTAEVLVHVIEAGGLDLTPEAAAALYVGLVTDTGRFGYRNSGPEAHRVAAELLRAGADGAALNRELYEAQPLERLRLLGRAVADPMVLAGGRLLVAVLDEEDFAAAGGDDSEGIVEALRGVRDTQAAALVRHSGRTGAWRVSLRAGVPELDVSAIAREEGGGGHRAAAGFSTRRPPDDLVPWIERRIVAQLDG